MKPMNKYLKSVLIIVGALVLAVLVWYGFLAGLEKISRRRIGILNFVIYAIGSGLVGTIIGYGMVYGSRLKKGALLQTLAVIATVLVLTVSNYLRWRHWESGKLVASVSSLFLDPLRENPYLILFWLVAIMTAWSLTSKKPSS